MDPTNEFVGNQPTFHNCCETTQNLHPGAVLLPGHHRNSFVHGIQPQLPTQSANLKQLVSNSVDQLIGGMDDQDRFAFLLAAVNKHYQKTTAAINSRVTKLEKKLESKEITIHNLRTNYVQKINTTELRYQKLLDEKTSLEIDNQELRAKLDAQSRKPLDIFSEREEKNKFISETKSLEAKLQQREKQFVLAVERNGKLVKLVAYYQQETNKIKTLNTKVEKDLSKEKMKNEKLQSEVETLNKEKNAVEAVVQEVTNRKRAILNAESEKTPCDENFAEILSWLNHEEMTNDGSATKTDKTIAGNGSTTSGGEGNSTAISNKRQIEENEPIVKIEPKRIKTEPCQHEPLWRELDEECFPNIFSFGNEN